MSKAEYTRQAKRDTNQIKRQLMEIMYGLQSEGLASEADRLDKIVARLEQWQNTGSDQR